jgi:4-methyl-5(b-hydroxyethyl)-thiazole monophosphate biosynthesis
VCALIILGDGFEEIEVVAPADILLRAGVSVKFASVDSSNAVRGAHCIVVQADGPLGNFSPKDFGAIVIPGGPAVGALRKNGAVKKFVAEALSAGKLMCAICAAPSLLKDLGALDGHNFTAYPGCVEGSDKNCAVVRSGQIVTGRDPGSAVQFGLAIVDQMVGSATADSVASAIGAKRQLPGE